MIARKLWIVTLAALMVAGAGFAQNADEAERPPAGHGISLEELAQFLKEARARRLGMERQQVAAEINEGLLFDPDKIDPAVKALLDSPKNTWDDNADRICRAFAMVDPRFGKAWAKFDKGDYEAAAQAAKPLISERDTSYLAAAKRFCYAESLVRIGRDEDAVEAYTDLVKAMPDRFSFSALALLRAGRTYEKMNRRLYAMSLYKLWVDNFGLLDPETADELSKRSEEIAADYEDPLATLSKKMSVVEKRLAGVDSGRTTQQKQREIVAMLDDLIATAEESSQGQGKGKGQGKGQGKCASCGKSGCQGGCQGGGQGKGGKRGPASGIGIPSSPATVSRLVGGPLLKPTGLSEIRPSDPTDDWGVLPPRERRKLLEAFKETMPERYRRMIGDYYRRLASEPTR